MCFPHDDDGSGDCILKIGLNEDGLGEGMGKDKEEKKEGRGLCKNIG